MNKTAALAILAVCALLPLGAFGGYVLLRGDPAARDQAFRAAVAWSEEAARFYSERGQTGDYNVTVAHIRELKASNLAALRATHDAALRELSLTDVKIEDDPENAHMYRDQYERWGRLLDDMREGL